ncbi:DUF732 domain-containing protein [Terracoccus sp. 273MFTsu3.1]|uniref:DUF732 domain-containing protein n=1 Tax=Terracoccus sp. 273MFTsu3.1 TaxID=1172188 RepID=UPI0003759B80|nr:DUF732 domain-containing protein [Terracoccus sp. 273MFTsu3.1]
MNTKTPAHAPRPYAVRPALRGALAAGVGLVVVLSIAACGGSDPTLGDLPAGVADARPSISAEEAQFVLAAQQLGASVTGATVDDDIETGTTTCWALKNGGVELAQIAVDDEDKPLGNTGDALRTKQLMAAGVQAFCPDYDDQVSQLDLP